jgi:hypothetical protein
MRKFRVNEFVIILMTAVTLSCSAVYGDQGEELINAARINDLNRVQSLLDEAVNVNARHGDGWTALMWAVQKGNLEVLKQLLAAGAEVNARDHFDGRTALILASYNGFAEIVELLLKRSADVNIEDKWGTTAGYWAIECGHTRIAGLLKAHGARIPEREPSGVRACFGLYSGMAVAVLLLVGCVFAVAKAVQFFVTLRWAEAILKTTKYYFMALGVAEGKFFVSCLAEWGISGLDRALSVFFFMNTLGPIFLIFGFNDG